jgi:hypothetical protein
MSLAEAERVAAERIRLLELEGMLQRNELAATFTKWEKRKALAWGSTLAGWGLKAGATLFAQPRLRWLIVSTLLSRLRGRGAR